MLRIAQPKSVGTPAILVLQFHAQNQEYLYKANGYDRRYVLLVVYILLLQGHNKNILSLAVSEDKKKVYTGSFNGRISILCTNCTCSCEASVMYQSWEFCVHDLEYDTFCCFNENSCNLRSASHALVLTASHYVFVISGTQNRDNRIFRRLLVCSCHECQCFCPSVLDEESL